MQWTTADDRVLIEAALAGKTARELAPEMDGRTYSAVQWRMSRIQLSAIAKSDKGAKPRRCLPCGEIFGSTHVGNRICPACKVREYH